MKWVEAAKEGQDYVLSAELKEKRDTIEAEAAEVLKKSGATPCTLYEIDAAIEEGDMSQAHRLVGDWRKELDDYLALNEKECGTHDDGAGDEAAVAKTKE